ncbi:MAG: ACT domain-containing protein [Chitinophagaceae bacterium]|nr:ACT domain-containing protein [Chitinophagaceae bacterium]
MHIILASLKPQLHAGTYVFCTTAEPPREVIPGMVMLFREAEGYTLVLPQEDADKLGLSYTYKASWITLTLHSALDAVGLTAAFSQVLADQGISCNVVAAFHHDHIFVSVEDAKRAMDALTLPPSTPPAAPY